MLRANIKNTKNGQIYINFIQPKCTISVSSSISLVLIFVFQYITPHMLISRKSTEWRGLLLPPELCKSLRVLADIKVTWFGYLASQDLLLRKLQSLGLLPQLTVVPHTKVPEL